MTQHATQSTNSIKWILFVIALAVTLWVEELPNASEGQMVRAILLEQTEAQYKVAVLYQNPEAAANSADVRTPFEMAQAEGDTLAVAFQALEQKFSGEVSYQLSDYLLLCGRCDQATMTAYAKQLQQTGQGRYAAKVSYLVQDIATLEQLVAQDATTADALMARLEEDTLSAPRLYQCDSTQNGAVMPLLSFGQDKALATEKTLYTLSQMGVGEYDETQTQLYTLLNGIAKGQTCDFMVGDIACSIDCRVLSQADPLRLRADETTSVETLQKVRVDARVSRVSSDARQVYDTIKLYLMALANDNPDLLAQLGIGEVEVRLWS